MSPKNSLMPTTSSASVNAIYADMTPDQPGEYTKRRKLFKVLKKLIDNVKLEEKYRGRSRKATPENAARDEALREEKTTKTWEQFSWLIRMRSRPN